MDHNQSQEEKFREWVRTQIGLLQGAVAFLQQELNKELSQKAHAKRKVK
jgi:uncharacterized membrane protein YidH (DUF202 family)